MRFKTLLSLALVAAMAAPSLANTFEIGTEGFDGGANNWPGGEAPLHVIDGVGQKYLNFGREYTGFAITPENGASVATSIEFWAANDSPGRDPASYELWGTNESADPAATSLPLAAFTPISVGDIMLPESRNDGSDAELLPENAYAVSFDNAAEYTSYLVLFPTVKDSGENSMQIAEVQLYDASLDGIFEPDDAIVGGQLVPEPAAGLLAAFSILGLMVVRKRR